MVRSLLVSNFLAEFVVPHRISLQIVSVIISCCALDLVYLHLLKLPSCGELLEVDCHQLVKSPFFV